MSHDFCRTTSPSLKCSGNSIAASPDDKATHFGSTFSSPQLGSEKRLISELILYQQALEQDHKIALSALQSQHKEEVSRLREEARHEPPTRDNDELTELKRRLCLLEEGYEAQISALKQQYEEALGNQPDMCEEKVRQRYQVEIEHLRVSIGNILRKVSGNDYLNEVWRDIK